jgi:hypothetical protein
MANKVFFVGVWGFVCCGAIAVATMTMSSSTFYITMLSSSTANMIVSSSYQRISVTDKKYLAHTIIGVYHDVKSLSWCAMLASNVAPEAPFYFDGSLRKCIVGTAACNFTHSSSFCWIPSKGKSNYVFIQLAYSSIFCSSFID